MSHYVLGEMPRYRVTAVVVVVKTTSTQGADKYLYRGNLVPADADVSHVEHLLELGMIEKIEVTA